MAALRRLALTSLRIALGSALGLLILETTLRANPHLLLRGMGLPAPVDPPITVQVYDVHYSDADIFFWIPGLIHPVPPEDDRREGTVRFETDEFGFPNAAPLSARVDVVVLGRSYSLGAQSADPWPRRLSEQSGWRVLNLSQPGSGIDIKREYLGRFGLPRQPRWVIVEVLPSMDIIGYHAESPLLLGRLPFPVLQTIARQLRDPTAFAPTDAPIYPLQVDIPGRSVELTFFDFYLAALTVDEETIRASSQWSAYREELLSLVRQARNGEACVALLYAPTKETVYFPLAIDPEQLEPALGRWEPWRLDSSGALTQSGERAPSVEVMQANATAGRDILAEFAGENGLPLIDPTDRMIRAVLAGDSPFMHFDTHWSALGHEIVGQMVFEMLREVDCH
jgi:hypothetical protein